MQLLTNTISVNAVREETHQGREYLVSEVTAAQPMKLNGGYVSAEEFQESTAAWEHTPLPIGHPVDVHGNYISARIPEVIENAVVGHFQNVYYDEANDELNGELWVDAERANALGSYGERIVEILENGEELEVSTAYSAEDGDPGYYAHDPDGNPGETYYDEVKANLRPDHVALLPEELGPGKCSCDDGCGVAPSDGLTENADGTVANTFGVSGHSPTSDGPEAVPGAGLCVNGQAGRSADRVYVNMRPDSNEDTGGRERHPSAHHSEADHDMNINQTEGDRVRWESSDGNWRYGIVIDEADDSDEVEDDEALVAVYIQEEDGWTRSDEEATVQEENLVEIGEFPAEAMSSNANANANADDGGDDDTDTPAIHGNILAEARVPEYSETAWSNETDLESWELWWGLDEYLEAWAEETDTDYEGDPYSALSEVPEDARGWIAGHSLLGNPDAETEENLLLGTVVSPDGTLHEELLEEVLGTTGARWTIPDEQRESARDVARRLLADEFGHEFDGIEGNATNGNTDAEEALGTIQSLLQRVGLVGNDNADADADDGPTVTSNGGEVTTDTACDCDSGTHEGCQCTETNDDDHEETTNTTTMTDFSDDDYERLANATSFGTEQLRRMEDEQLDSLNDLVENAAEATDAPDSDPESDPESEDVDADASDVEGSASGDGDGGESGSEDGDVDANADDDTVPDAVQDEIADLRETVNAQQEVIDTLNANHNEKERQRRERAQSAIQANSEQYTDEQLEAMDTEVLETTANALQAAKTSADWGGLNEPHPAQIDGNADDESEGTSTGGSFAQYVANKNKESEAGD